MGPGGPGGQGGVFGFDPGPGGPGGWGPGPGSQGGWGPGGWGSGAGGPWGAGGPGFFPGPGLFRPGGFFRGCFNGLCSMVSSCFYCLGCYKTALVALADHTDLLVIDSLRGTDTLALLIIQLSGGVRSPRVLHNSHLSSHLALSIWFIVLPYYSFKQGQGYYPFGLSERKEV